MPRTRTFVSWLRLQRHRNDPIGDLAKDALVDPELGPNFSVEDLRQRLIDANACVGAREALHQARKEYRAWAC